jgi:lipopolysaccharide transport system permease protein
MKFLPQTIEYDSAKQHSPLVTEILDLYRYRDLLSLLVKKNIKRRYKRSVIGVAWTLLSPLLTMAFLAIAFSNLFRFSLPRYPVYLLAGIIYWNFFSQTTQDAMHTLIEGGSLIKKIYIPRTIFGLSAIGNGLVNLLLALIPLTLIVIILGHSLTSALFFLPLALVITALFAFGVGLFLSAVAVFFIDVVYIYQVFLGAWFYLTPVIYPKEILPNKYLWYLNLNPMYTMLEIFRLPIYSGVLPGRNTIFAAVTWALFSLFWGFWFFTKKADEFAYRI